MVDNIRSYNYNHASLGWYILNIEARLNSYYVVWKYSSIHRIQWEFNYSEKTEHVIEEVKHTVENYIGSKIVLPREKWPVK